MKTRFLCGALVVSLCAATGYAEPCTQELKARLAAKREQMDVLQEKIIKREAIMLATQQKLSEMKTLFKEIKKLYFLSENSGKDVVEKDFDDAFDAEWLRLVKEFTDVKSKTVGDKPFKWEYLSPIKFYVIKYFCDTCALYELLADWDKLSIEYLAIGEQIDLIKKP